jgi:ribosomal protein S18 acetylase RimI-like enzyme
LSALRPPSAGDIPLVLTLFARHWPEPVDEERVARAWDAPGFDPALDARVAEDVYVAVQDIGDGRAWIELQGGERVDALEWAEQRAAEKGAARLMSGAWSTDEDVLAALGARGYERVRQSQRMEIALGGARFEQLVPDGIAVRPLRPGEERAVYEVHHEAFRDTWEEISSSYEEWAHWNLQPPRFVPELWFLACAGEEICGIALSHPHPTAPDLGWLGILGVRREWRGRGIGRALLLRVFAAFAERGFERVALGVDSDSPTGAHALYEAVGMRVTRRYEILEKGPA